MPVFGELGALTLTQSDFLLFIPMALAGFVICSAVPCRTRAAHYSLEAGGTVLGVVAALFVIASLPLWF